MQKLVIVKARSQRKIANNKGNSFASKYDPFGSYTGVSEGGDPPIQDADDL